MTQHELDMAVAAATGEDLADIAIRGFSLSQPDRELEIGIEIWQEPSVLDWDATIPKPTLLSALFPECG